MGDYSSQFWFCPRCGQQNQYELKHCPKCETMQPVVSTFKPQPQAARQGVRSSASWIMSSWSWIVSSQTRSIIGVLLMSVGLAVALFLVSFTVADRPETLPPASVIETVFLKPEMFIRAPRGKAIFEKLPPIPEVQSNPTILRSLSVRPLVSVMVTEKSWNELSKDQQIDLTWYVQSLIPKVRANPEAYLVMWKALESSRDFFQSYFYQDPNNGNICSDCWEIFIGNFDKNGALRSLDGPVVVRGDSAWKKEERGLKASEFRQ